MSDSWVSIVSKNFPYAADASRTNVAFAPCNRLAHETSHRGLCGGYRLGCVALYYDSSSDLAYLWRFEARQFVALKRGQFNSWLIIL